AEQDELSRRLGGSHDEETVTSWGSVIASGPKVSGVPTSSWVPGASRPVFQNSTPRPWNWKGPSSGMSSRSGPVGPRGTGGLSTWGPRGSPDAAGALNARMVTFTGWVAVGSKLCLP